MIVADQGPCWGLWAVFFGDGETVADVNAYFES